MRLLQIIQSTNEDAAVCTKCGGACCKEQPGITAPAQWGTSAEEIKANLTAAFVTGKWAVDWWEGGTESGGTLNEVYFVRPAAKYVTDFFHGAGHNRECVFLGSEGCALTASERPDGCLQLIPSRNAQDCLPKGAPSKEFYAKAWRSHQKEILAAAGLVGHRPEDRYEDEIQPWSWLRW